MIYVLEILSVLLDFADDFFRRLGDLLGDLWDDFPNPVKMADDLVGFFTGLLGIVVGSAATSYFSLASKVVAKGHAGTEEEIGRPYQHVMTPEGACLWFADVLSEVVKFASNTSDNSLVFFIAQRFGMWLYHTFKRFKLVLKLIAIETEADAIALIVSIFKSRAATLMLTAVVAIVTIVLILAVATVGKMFFVGVSLIDPLKWQDYVLFANHKRRKELTRIYRRVGGVSP